MRPCNTRRAPRSPSQAGFAAQAGLLLVLASLLAVNFGCARGYPRENLGMVLIPGGEFIMGSDEGFADESPSHRVRVESFYLDTTEVTNRQFAEFVEATGYETESEKQGGSGVFDPQSGQWALLEGADWRHPNGPESSIDGKEDFPVVHVSWNDANAYAQWAGKRLPTEAEWEYAALGGQRHARYPWGDELTPQGKHRANVWQGRFPAKDAQLDGFAGLAPVKRYPPSGYGLFDIGGNVWEWVADWYAPDYYLGAPAENPLGPPEGREKVHRGGSWLCSQKHCQGYRVAARQKTTPDTALNHLGFRCAAD